MEAMNPDVEALMALRNGLQDPNGELNSWDPDLVDACTWSRVVCDDLTRRVIRLYLIQLNLSGPFAPELGKMEHLHYLRLDHNRLTGPVPNELLALDKLADANFSNNKLCGIIPTSGSFENIPQHTLSSPPKLTRREMPFHLRQGRL
ncbi:leucine-rich repeat protein 1 [Brachypodium distachyon]|uniref:leucine-rich repeat protein 1 n=1 Tax=Brachypodium distachyon TaxID=15368 RepID=UPI000D0D9AE5|nr:leucine-rich repeat protein 1 [Brachypodium distachyon]|eukprot:XP_024314532.1 leucine-rich repeat protein 1 [Brachypodium distachyon]